MKYKQSKSKANAAQNNSAEVDLSMYYFQQGMRDPFERASTMQYWILLTSYCLASLFTDPHTKIAVLLPGLCFLKIVNRCLSNNIRVLSSGICAAVSPKPCCILVFWVLPTTAGLLRLYDLLPSGLSVKRISRN